MGSVNKVILIGNLGRDAELRVTPTGSSVTTLSLATTEKWTDRSGQRQEKTEWHRVVFWVKSDDGSGGWGRITKPVVELLLKGRQVYVEGRLETRSWTDKDGNKKYTTEIKGDKLVLLGSGRGGGHIDRDEPTAMTDQPKEPVDLADDDIPF